MLPINSKTQSHSHLHFKIFFSHQGLVQQLVCSGQAVDTFHIYSQWLLLMGQTLSYSTPKAYEYRLPGKSGIWFETLVWKQGT